MSDFKKRIENIILKQHEKEAGKPSIKTRKKNKSPEKKQVVELISFCKANRIYIHRIESKGKWSATAGTYVKGETESGYPDLSGNTYFGVAFYLEAKAIGKRTNLSHAQYIFLEKKIKQGCFATVADTKDKLSLIYNGWLMLYKKGNMEKAQKFLLEMLPKKKFKEVEFDLTEASI